MAKREDVGSADEAFVAEEFPAAVQGYSQGEVQIIEGETHDGIYQNEAVMTAAHTWITSKGRLIHHMSTAFLLDTLKGDEAAHEALLPDAVQFPGIEYATRMQ